MVIVPNAIYVLCSFIRFLASSFFCLIVIVGGRRNVCVNVVIRALSFLLISFFLSLLCSFFPLSLALSLSLYVYSIILALNVSMPLFQNGLKKFGFMDGAMEMGIQWYAVPPRMAIFFALLRFFNRNIHIPPYNRRKYQTNNQSITPLTQT